MKSKRTAGWVAVVGLVGVLGLGPGARADEEEIPLDRVPKAVIDAGKALFPRARVREASKETERGATVYELAMTNEGRRTDATFREDGTLVLVEVQVPEKDVPAAVLRPVKDKYPGATIVWVESVRKGPRLKDAADYYELHITTAGGKSVELEVDATGKILNTEE